MRVLIVGAGVSGLSLAAMLRRLNIHCIVVERLPDFETVYQPPVTLWANALTAYSAFDIGTVMDPTKIDPEPEFGIRQAAAPHRWLQRMQNREVQQLPMEEGDIMPSSVAPTSTSASLISQVILESTKVEVAAVPLRMTISAAKLKHSLRQLVSDVRFGRAVVDLFPAPLGTRDGGVTVVLDNGHTETVDLVVGCDGLYSTVRRLVYPQQVEAHTPLSQNVTQVDGYLRVGEFPASLGTSPCELWGHRKTLTYCPMSDYGKSKYIGFSATMYESPHDIVGVGELSNVEEATKACRGVLAREFADFGEDVVKFLRIAEVAVPAELLEVPIMPQWHNRRAVLLGDAAHGSLPSFISQDASLCVEDAAMLATAIHQIPTMRDSGFSYSFRRYERARRQRVEQFIRQTRSARRLACTKHPAVRDALMRAVPSFVSLRAQRWLTQWSYSSRALDDTPEGEIG